MARLASNNAGNVNLVMISPNRLIFVVFILVNSQGREYE